MNNLFERAQRFGELSGNVKASRVTLATRIKEAEELGLVRKEMRKEDGSFTYTLTKKEKDLKEDPRAV